MLYVITEDSGSGKQFWEHLVDAYMSEYRHQISVISSRGGEGKLITCVSNILSGIKPGEQSSMVLLFDKAAGLNTYYTLEALSIYISKAKQDGRIKYAYLSSYFSFEEFILTSDIGILREDGWRGRLVELIRFCIENDINWYRTKESQPYIKESGQGGKGREATSYKILNQCFPKLATASKKQLCKCLIGDNKNCRGKDKCKIECIDHTLEILDSNITRIDFNKLLLGVE